MLTNDMSLAEVKYEDLPGPRLVEIREQIIRIFGVGRTKRLLVLRALPEPDDWSLRCEEPFPTGPVMISNREMVEGKKIAEICLGWKAEIEAVNAG